MSKNMQNLVLLMEPSEYAAVIDLKGGNMCLNRFFIDEEAAFELSRVRCLKKASYPSYRKSVGKGYLIII